MRPHTQLWLSWVMDCKLRYTADVPPHAHGVALCCCWVLGCSRIAALYDNSCLFVARSQISVLAVVTTLLTNHINLACHNARHNSDLIGAGSTCKTKKIRLELKTLPLSLAPVPQNTFPRTSYTVLDKVSIKKKLLSGFGMQSR